MSGGLESDGSQLNRNKARVECVKACLDPVAPGILAESETVRRTQERKLAGLNHRSREFEMDGIVAGKLPEGEERSGSREIGQK